MPGTNHTLNDAKREEAYMLPRGKQETSRLNAQHLIISEISRGHLISPLIELDTIHTVADVGTGTGVWLHEVAGRIGRCGVAPTSKTSSLDGADSLPKRFVGFDISPQQFPVPSPEGLTFALHDVTEPFPEKYRDTFDLVNVRMLGFALKEVDLRKAVVNITEIVRPGGFLQWQECDVTDMWSIPTTSKVSTIQRLVSEERVARGLCKAFIPSLIHAMVLDQLASNCAGYNDYHEQETASESTSDIVHRDRTWKLSRYQLPSLHIEDITTFSSAGLEGDPLIQHCIKQNVANPWHRFLCLILETREAMLMRASTPTKTRHQARQDLRFVNETLEELSDSSSELLDRQWGMNVTSIVAKRS